MIFHSPAKVRSSLNKIRNLNQVNCNLTHRYVVRTFLKILRLQKAFLSEENRLNRRRPKLLPLLLFITKPSPTVSVPGHREGDDSNEGLLHGS